MIKFHLVKKYLKNLKKAFKERFHEIIELIDEIIPNDLIYYFKGNTPMDTSSSIRHRFDVEIPRGKFVEVSSILEGESTWKL